MYPDGDTVGSAVALCRALHMLGKKARMECGHAIPEKYNYLTDYLQQQSFEPSFTVAVDVADPALLGEGICPLVGEIDLCIDHHHSNIRYAKEYLIDGEYASTAELVYEVIKEMGLTPDRLIGEAVYTGISTDTGCFRYSNTTPHTHQTAAELIQMGVDSYAINKAMFETKTRARIEMERLALDSMEFFFDDKCALMYITRDMIERTGIKEDDLEGLTPIPRQIEGVEVGVTFREREDGGYKVSVRSNQEIDAAGLCAKLNGGGHKRAAGCTILQEEAQAKETVLRLIEKELNR